MQRREFITFLGASPAAWPLSARAQQRALPVVGYLSSNSGTGPNPGFREGLKQAGYVEGQNVAIEYRSANAQLERVPALATDLVHRQVAVIVASGAIVAANAVKATTSTIPIVVSVGDDPVRRGLVASLNRPGGNITGVTNFTHDLAAKRLQFLSELVPQATTVAYLGEAGRTSFEDQKSDIIGAARTLGLEVIVPEFRSQRDYEAAFATIVERRAGALIIGAFPILLSTPNRLLALTAKHKIPAVYPGSHFVRRGGLISYSANVLDHFYQVGVYVGRILQGAKPADLPILQPTKFELAINMKTAKALGLTVPLTLQVAADEVIE